MRQSPWYESCKWIWAPDYDDTSPEGRIRLFRRRFDLASAPTESCLVKVSADTRYRLYVNGVGVSVGPCKSYPERWHYETVDIRPHLREGRNTISARVLRFSEKHAGSLSLMRSALQGFILHCEVQGLKLHTNTEWEVAVDDSVTFASRKEWNYALGPPFLVLNEHVDGRRAAHHWLDDNSEIQWVPSQVITMGSMMLPVLEPRKLVERPIPPLTETPARLARVVCCSDPPRQAEWTSLATDGRPLEIPPHSKVWVELEASGYTTAYVTLKLHAGTTAARVQLLFSECYEKPMSRAGPGTPRVKANRTDHAASKLYGMTDDYTTHPGDNVYEPFWFRAFRFVRLEVETVDAPLRLDDILLRKTYYPLAIASSVRTNTTDLDALWTVGVDTLRNCMHETYEDCPFYEQNQFLMDSRLQMLFTYALSRDDRLARKTIREFHASRREDGLLAAQFPAPARCVNIPLFSLFFVPVLHDHMGYFSDRRLVREYLPTVDGILSHFDGLLDSHGLVGHFDADDWAFVDWVEEWTGPPLHGMCMPPAYHSSGPATIFSLVYAWALRLAAELARFGLRPDTAAEYETRATAITTAVNSLCFDGTWYVDGPGRTDRSQHCQVFAVLAGAVSSGDAAAALVRRTVENNDDMPRCSYATAFYLFRAAAAAGVYEELWPRLIRPWRTMLEQGLVTFAESESMPRSDCHGWSATPIYEIAAEVFGVKPSSVDGRVWLAPRWSLLPAGASGTFVTATGIVLEISREEAGLAVEADGDVTILYGNSGEEVFLVKAIKQVLPVPRV